MNGRIWDAWLGATLAMLALLGNSAQALADDLPQTAQRTDRHRVILVVGASAEDAGALDSSLRELLARIGARLEVRRVERLDVEDLASSEYVEPEASTLAVVWLDLRGAADAIVTIADGQSNRVLLRRRIERGDSTNMTVEAVAHVIQSSVEELVDASQHPAPARTEPAAAAPVVRPVAAPPAREALAPATVPVEDGRSGWGLDLGGFFGGRAFGGGASLVIGGGGTATLSTRRGPWRPALWLSGEVHVASDVPGDLVSVHAQVLSLRLLPTVQIAGRGSWILEAGFGGGTDVFFTSPRSSDLPAARLANARSDIAPVMTALLAGHVAVARTTDLTLALVLDADLAPHRYVADDGGVHQAVFAPWRFRPAIMFGFTFAALGPAPYPTVGGAGR